MPADGTLKPVGLAQRPAGGLGVPQAHTVVINGLAFKAHRSSFASAIALSGVNKDVVEHTVADYSFKPTTNLEFGFERTVLWGGKGHVPITIHSFLRSFVSASARTSTEKFSHNDPGALRNLRLFLSVAIHTPVAHVVYRQSGP